MPKLLRTFGPFVFLWILSGCSDYPSAPEGIAPITETSHSQVTSFNVWVDGFTIGPNGEIYMESSKELCGFQTTYFSDGIAKISYKEYCGPPAFDTSGIEMVNGGEANIWAEWNGESKYIGAVSGDMSEITQHVEIPSDGRLKMRADPSAGCAFTHWTKDDNHYSVDSTIYVYPTEAGSSFRVHFNCMS